jgi:hypothetical protein
MSRTTGRTSRSTKSCTVSTIIRSVSFSVAKAGSSR